MSSAYAVPVHRSFLLRLLGWLLILGSLLGLGAGLLNPLGGSIVHHVNVPMGRVSNDVGRLLQLPDRWLDLEAMGGSSDAWWVHQAPDLITAGLLLVLGIALVAGWRWLVVLVGACFVMLSCTSSLWPLWEQRAAATAAGLTWCPSHPTTGTSGLECAMVSIYPVPLFGIDGLMMASGLAAILLPFAWRRV